MKKNTKINYKNDCSDIEALPKPSMTKMINIIENATRYNDEDVRACFWLYVSGINNKPTQKKKQKEKLKRVIGCLRNTRVDLYNDIIVKAMILITK